jgi:hypothetical protein
MAIPDSDPRAKDLDAAFAAAAAGPQRPRAEAPAPADVDQEAPHGRAEDGTPNAPFGLTKDGKVKRTAGGRPAKGSPDQARTGPAAGVRADAEASKAKDAKPEKAKPTPHDWSEDLDGFGDGIWFAMSAASQVVPHIPVIGKRIPAEKIAAEAFLLAEVKPRLVAAVNLAAQHSARAEKFCKSLEGGEGLWALTVMFMVMPVVSAGMTIWKGDEAELISEGLPSIEEMSKKNAAKMDEMVSRINAQITAATLAKNAIVVCQREAHAGYGQQGCVECATPAAA